MNVNTGDKPATCTEPFDEMGSVWCLVLGRDEPVGLDDSFFEIGGDSISAVLVLIHVGQMTGHEYPIRLFFQNPRLRDFVAAIDSWVPEDGTEMQTEFPQHDTEDAHPLSYMQRQLWFIEQLDPGTTAYNVPLLYKVTGKLDIETLTAAFEKVMARHAILRTYYESCDGRPVQRAAREVAMPWSVERLAGDDRLRAESWVAARLATLFEAPFDLAKGPQIRAGLLDLGGDSYLLAFCVHHIAFDGWSAGVLMRDLAAFYNGADLPPPKQYVAYVGRQMAMFQPPNRNVLLGKWAALLADLPAPRDIPTDQPRGPTRGRAGLVTLVVPSVLALEIRRLARGAETTVYVILFAALSVLLSRYSRQCDVLIGTPMANRGGAEYLDMVGFFANSLVIRNKVSGPMAVQEFVRATGQSVQAALAQQETPFELLVEMLNPERSIGRNPIFDVAFLYQNAGQTAVSFGGTEVVPQHVGNVTAKFDLSLIATVTEDAIQLEWEYDDLLYEEESVEIMSQQYRKILEDMSSNWERQVGEIALRTAKDWQVISELNATERVLPDISVADMFRSIARGREARTAIISGEVSVSYAQLEQWSEGLAEYLVGNGVEVGDPVGLLMERGIEAVVWMLAIAKAGGVYLPIDPESPPSRIEFVTADAAVHVVITGNNDYTRLLPVGLAVVPAALRLLPGGTPLPTTGPRDPLYLMYTSGSTGNPKGVRIPQEGVLRLVTPPSIVPLSMETVMLHATSINFDLSAFEIWGAILNGGLLVIAPGGFDSREVSALINQHGVNTAWMTSGVLEVFAGSVADSLPSLRWLVAGGDVVPPKAVAKLYAINPQIRIFNGYGPTENSILTTCYEIPPTHATESAVPIGKPISNSQIEVIDAAGQPAGLGLPGELICHGRSVGLGYHNRPDLNDERFPSDPVRPGLLQYCTGDLVRWKPNGDLQFYGRIDSQVKIRGYRVEPAEIELVLQRHEAVALGAVTVHGEGAAEKFLVGWVKPRAGCGVSEKEVAEWLVGQLPPASRPAHIRIMEEVPVTLNGKIDRRALTQRFAFRRLDLQLAALTEKGGAVVEIWRDLLRISGQVGADESFFELGGNSLISVQLIARVNDALGLDLPVRSVFESPTLREFINVVEGAGSGQLHHETRDSFVRLTPAAKWEWIGFPGAGATAASFLALSTAVGRDKERGFQAFEATEGWPPEEEQAAFDDVVREAVEAISRQSDAERLTLVGHSFGGRLAFEVARRIGARGQRIDLVLLDSLISNDLVDVDYTDVPDTELDVGKWIISTLLSDGARAGATLKDVRIEMARSGLVGERQVDALIRRVRVQLRMNRNYRPSGPFNAGRVGLVYATQGLIGKHPAEAIEHDVKKYCPMARAVPFDGTHFTMLRDGDVLLSAIETVLQIDGSGH